MRLMKMLARRGAVGSTARWAAKGYFAFQIMQPDSSLKDLCVFLSDARYSGRGLREQQAINDLIEQDEIQGLAHFVIMILIMEAGYSENTPDNQRMFREVIMEELEAAKVPSGIIHIIKY